MSAPQTPNTKEKATAATTDLKDTLTLLCAALGPEVINMGVFKKMHALQPEGRTVSSWEHLFRPLKVKAKEMIKEKGGDDETNGESSKTKEKATKANKANKEPKDKPKGRKRKAANEGEEDEEDGGDVTPSKPNAKKAKSVKEEDTTDV